MSAGASILLISVIIATVFVIPIEHAH